MEQGQEVAALLQNTPDAEMHCETSYQQPLFRVCWGRQRETICCAVARDDLAYGLPPNLTFR
jgi:hypothetical protein